MKAAFLLLPLFFPFSFSHAEPPPRSVSGIYPSLAMFNQEGECGTGALVPWAGRLWVITYRPHLRFGSSDKLYEITPELTQIIRPESIGGTPANRMIHKESNQLAIGPYLIDSAGKRVERNDCLRYASNPPNEKAITHNPHRFADVLTGWTARRGFLCDSEARRAAPLCGNFQ